MTPTFRETVLQCEHGITPQSIVWHGDTLVDWVAGGIRYLLTGEIEPRHVSYAYRFDDAITSPSGRWVLLFERLGTKALLLDSGKIVRWRAGNVDNERSSQRNR